MSTVTTSRVPTRVSRLSLSLSLFLTGSLAVAQQPVVRPVHPSIAPPIAQWIYQGASPMFQYLDQLWNHGEGFVSGANNDADTGGWHGLDDGTGVAWDDVHFYGDALTGYPYQYYLKWYGFPTGAPEMRRFVGYLRPAGVPLPTQHPLYGTTIPFVDNAAFEVFAPLGDWNRSDPIVITIGHFATMVYPAKYLGNDQWKGYEYRTRYPGMFSPDGLARAEAKPGGVAGFVSNMGEDLPSTGRASQTTDLMLSWRLAGSQDFYPIAGYIVPPVIHRATELTLQRDLQLVQAIKHLLVSSTMSPINPPLTPSELANVTVVFLGGSNGGNQAVLGALLYPDIVHGAYGLTFGPDLQRVYGEQEMGWAISHLSGFADPGSQLAPIDTRNFGQCAWSHGYEFYDVSVVRRFALGQTWRPFCIYNADEDITGTGTDWMLLLGGGTAFQLAGVAQPTSTRSFAWTSGQKSSHYWRKGTDPYDGGSSAGLERKLIAKAIASRAGPTIPRPTPQTFPRLNRQAGEELRGIDDPHEWFLGRPGAPAAPWPSTNPDLLYDPGFFRDVQPDAAGTWLGHKESLVIRNKHVYVGSTEGVVSSFHVNGLSSRQELVRDAQSPQLGHEAWGMVFLDDNRLVVGTRRHLHLLQLPNLVPVATANLTWEQAKPYRMHLAEVDSRYSGKEVVFASAQGGIVAFGVGPSNQLVFSGEYTEPGVQDLLVSGTYGGLDVLTLLSERGVIANVVINMYPGSQQPPQALLTAASPPQEGSPIDLEMARLYVWNSQGGYLQPLNVALYSGDDHGFSGFSLRLFEPSALFHVGTVPNITASNGPGRRFEIVPVHHHLDATLNGDHILVLFNDSLILYNEAAQVVGRKQLFKVYDQAQPPSGRIAAFTPGMHACAIAAGELVDSTSAEYPEEIVVATQTGHLMWMHLSEVAATVQNRPPDEMPDLYAMYNSPSAYTNVQPRTNQALSCAWGIAEHPSPSESGFLHLIDQDDNHWKVDHQGWLQLVSATTAIAGLAREVRGCGYLGVSGVSSSFQSYEVLPPGLFGEIQVRAWCPFNALDALKQKDSPGEAAANNWVQRYIPLFMLDGFAIFAKAGDVLSSAGSRDCFWWSDSSGLAWSNMAHGLHLSSGVIDGVWASTSNSPPVNGNQDFLDLRNIAAGFPSNDQQSLRVVTDGTERYLVLGCPGGTVRVVHAGGYDQGPGVHEMGYEASTSQDYGHGGCGLAVMPDATGIDIYFGVIARHAVAVTYPNQPLQNSEVMTGRIVKLRFVYAEDSLSPDPVWVRDLEPTATDRGGYGVVGIYVDEIFANSPEEKEVVVTTMSGDVFIYSESGVLRYRASVPGAAGFYNSIIARNLNPASDNHKELYISGSMGLHRFVSPSEQGVHP